MRFLRPDLLRWWEVLPVLVACWGLHWHYTQSVRHKAVAERFWPLSRRSGVGRQFLVLALALVAGGALVFALARPQALLTDKVPQYERQDLIILLDRSVSMRAHDIQPSRFSRAIAEIHNFLRNKPDAIDRVGLVGFADASIILSYLTSDTDSIEFYLDWIDRDQETLLGTDIGASLKSGLDVIAKDDRPTRKLFLMISDGEDFGPELNKEVAKVQAAGYHLNTIGVGSDQEVPIPVLDAEGRETYLRDEGGQVVKTKYSETTLRALAAATGGRYERSTSGTELAKAIDDIVKGERKVLGWKTTTEYRDLYEAGLTVAAAAGAVLWLML